MTRFLLFLVLLPISLLSSFCGKAQDVSVVGVTDERSQLSYSILLKDMLEGYLQQYQADYTGKVGLAVHPGQTELAIRVDIKNFPTSHKWAGGAKGIVSLYEGGKRKHETEQLFTEYETEKVKDWEADLERIAEGSSKTLGTFRIKALKQNSPLAQKGLKVGSTFEILSNYENESVATISFKSEKGKQLKKKIRTKMRSKYLVADLLTQGQIEQQLVLAVRYAAVKWFSHLVDEKELADALENKQEPLAKSYVKTDLQLQKTSRLVLPLHSGIPLVPVKLPNELVHSGKVLQTGTSPNYRLDLALFKGAGKIDYLNYQYYYHNRVPFYAYKKGEYTSLVRAVNELSFPLYQRFEVGVIKYLSAVDFINREDFAAASVQLEEAFMSARRVSSFPQIYIAELQKAAMLRKSRCSDQLGMHQLASLERHLGALCSIYEKLQLEEEAEQYVNTIQELAENLDETDATIKQQKKQAFWGTIGDIALLSVASVGEFTGDALLADMATTALTDGVESRIEAKMAMDEYLATLGEGIDLSDLLSIEGEEEAFNRLLFTTTLVRLLYTVPEPDFLLDRYLDYLAENAKGTKFHELIKGINTSDLNANQKVFAELAKLEKVVFLYEQLGKEVPEAYRLNDGDE